MPWINKRFTKRPQGGPVGVLSISWEIPAEGEEKAEILFTFSRQISILDDRAQTQYKIDAEKERDELLEERAYDEAEEDTFTNFMNDGKTEKPPVYLEKKTLKDVEGLPHEVISDAEWEFDKGEIYNPKTNRVKTGMDGKIPTWKTGGAGEILKARV